MEQLLTILLKLGDVALILVGFGLVVFIHELGHFLAAKWAGVRVLAFSIGFGPALVTFRKGLGFRRGSSEDDYKRWLVLKADGAAAPDSELSPTEYRLNALPLGGYVKMLGQDDADPGYRSSEHDSYNVVPIWKRMVIISAGVTMNVATAVLLYIAVFMVGIKTEAPVVGDIAEGAPAATAVAQGAQRLGIEQPGLWPGDTIASIDGKEPMSFNDIQLASAMAKPDTPMQIRVRRDGFAEELEFEITPVKSAMGLLTLGIAPSQTNRLAVPKRGRDIRATEALLDREGLGGVPLGSSLVSITGTPVTRPSDFTKPISQGMGAPVELVFEHAGQTVTRTTHPWPELDYEEVVIAGQQRFTPSLLGITPVMCVGELSPEAHRGYEQGLREGDIFVRLGAASYPDIARGTAEVAAHSGSTIEATVSRDGQLIDLALKVSRQGKIGFLIDWRHEHTVVAQSHPSDNPLSIVSTQLRPGSRVISIEGNAVSTFSDIARQLQLATDRGATEIRVTIELPITDSTGQPLLREFALALSPEQVEHLARMEWTLPGLALLFEPEMTVLKAEGPLAAIIMGVHETDRVMRTTYVTFLRLFQGSISPTNLNGPVGIVHTGTILADRGFIWLLFFFALVNINLAVVNFLPIPITDGGHMLFLIWEQITGRPVSIAVQNAATLAGLVLIVAVFLFVTYNDISRLLGS